MLTVAASQRKYIALFSNLLLYIMEGLIDVYRVIYNMCKKL
jgi:hypothetical protein